MSKPKRVKHGLIVDRQGHAYVPTCKCGAWRGVNARDRRGAESQYRNHVGSAEQHERTAKRRGGAQPAPRPTTAIDALPDGLS